mmetsp:Transcript_39834/g.98586  ORF Transcript_39834/g.98586 Transcript_39834/m.98586 type:complete len:260 (+) Transcript_39834:652-1431(+)
MMSAVKIFTFRSLAMRAASSLTLTSNARMVAYSGRLRSCITLAPITSRLLTGPMAMPATGIFTASLFRNSSSASREPSVDACTYTPSPLLSTRAITPFMSDSASSLSSSMSSPASASSTSMAVPATACSNPCATILTPIAPSMLLWCWYVPFTRISRIGCGVSSARMVVVMAPAKPATTMVCPSLSVPLMRMTSMVVPSPSSIFTSSTVHCTALMNCRRSFMRLCVRSHSRCIRSGMPSPECAEVGTTFTNLRGSGLFQ